MEGRGGGDPQGVADPKKGSGMDNFCVFQGHFVSLLSFWYLYADFGTFFSPFWFIVPRKIWRPWRGLAG
jgi:hypothetical protein